VPRNGAQERTPGKRGVPGPSSLCSLAAAQLGRYQVAKMRRTNRRVVRHRARLLGAVLVLALILAVSRSYALVGFVAIIIFVVCAVANPPSRHRSHSWGQIQQAQDHRLGIFGRAYPEDSTGSVRTRQVGRNDACPCGSGEKYKRCCGAC
jgi:hypothetical protein